MKRTTLLALIAASTFTTAGYSAEDRPADKKPAATKPGPTQSMGMGMMDDKQMAQMQEQIKRMQQQMEQIQQTKDPKVRQKLMDEHTSSMNNGMTMMRGMGGGMMMSMMGGKPGGMGPGAMGGGQMSGMDPKQRQDIMDKRMDMLQLMMEQMMQHQQMMQPRPAK